MIVHFLDKSVRFLMRQEAQVNWRRPVIALLVSMAALIAQCVNAHADRFLERMISKIHAQNPANQKAAAIYMAAAKVERRRLRNYQADHFARRAAFFMETNLQFKVPTLIYDASAIDPAIRDELEKHYVALSKTFECESTVPVETRVSASVAYETMVLDLLTKQTIWEISVDRTRLNRLQSIVSATTPTQTCEELPDNAEKASAFNWNIVALGDSSLIQFPPWMKSGELKGAPPIFGVNLDRDATAEHPCDVALNQRTVYFDIDRSTLRGDVEREVLRQVIGEASGGRRIFVETHADDPGSPQINAHVAKMRAEEIGTFLQSNGVAGDKIVALNLSTYCPQRPLNRKLFIAENRRVTIKIKE